MKKFLSLLAITVLVLQSSVTTLVYAQETNQEETDSKPNVETLKESVDNETISGDVSDPSNNGSQDAVEETQNDENDELTDETTGVDDSVEESDDDNDNANADTASDDDSDTSDEADETDEIDETDEADNEGEDDNGDNETDADGKLPDEAPLFRTLSTELNALSEVEPEAEFEDGDKFNPEDYVTYTPGDIKYIHPDGTKYDGIGTITITDGTNTITMLDRNLGADEAGTGVDSYGYYYQRGNIWGFPKSGDLPKHVYLPTDHKANILTQYSRNNLYSNDTFQVGCYYGPGRSSRRGCRTSKLNIESRGAPANIWGGNTDTPKTDYTRRAMCPEGYHIPTKQELIDLLQIYWNVYSGGNTSSLVRNSNGLFVKGQSFVKSFSDTFLIPFQGYRLWDEEQSYIPRLVRTIGIFWSSQGINASAYDLSIRNNHNGLNEIQAGDASPQTQGYPVRCFKDRADGRTTITFNTNGGTEIDPITQYPGTDVTAPADPTKQGYTFSGWDIEIPAIMPENDLTITAIWNVNQYLITFMDEDETTVLGTGMFDYGTRPTAPANPSKDSNARCDYTFDGWNPELHLVNGDETYIATYKCNVKQYEVTFVDEDGTSVLKAATSYPYGTLSNDIVKPADPTKVGYSFAGWTPSIVNVVDNATYRATYSINRYTITFDTDGGTEIAPITQNYNTPVEAPANPTKTGYTFAGWDTEIPEYMPAEDMTITAQWTINQYEITFVEEDGTTVISTGIVNYGDTPVAPQAPTKPATDECTYSFARWTPILSPADSDTTYRATYSCTKNEYTITFKDEDGTTISSENVEYGKNPTIPADPTKTDDVECTYTFAGWTPSVVSVTGPATYTARYSCTKKIYDINFVNEDGTPLKHEALEYGAKPTAPANPTKTGYSFAGWTPEVHDVTGPETYRATYTINQYTITFDTAGGTEIAPITQNYNTPVIAPANPTKTGYIFGGWDKEIPENMPAENITITAQWNINQYLITFEDDNGNVISTGLVNYGETPVAPENPNKPSTPECNYTFEGWNSDLTPVDGEKTYTAIFTCTPRQYTVTFDPNGGKIDGKNGNIEVTVTYNELVEKIASERIVHDNSNKHTFKYWSLNGAEFDFNTPITSDITLKAEWNINRDGGYSGGGRRGSSSEEEISFGGEVDLECSTEGSIYPDEWNEAYVYACENGIIDAQNIMDARLEDFLTRAEMAKIVSMFAMLTNAKEPNKAKDCSNFMDSISGYDQRMQDLMVMSCQLEYMGIHTVNYEPIPDFMPNKFVSRAEFGTILSRILWGNKFEGTDNARYQNHLANLKSEEILENIDPTLKEKRGYVILMVYRSAKNKGLIKNEEGLIETEE